MKRPDRQRRNPKRRQVVSPPEGVDLGAVATRVSYTGSPYHKDIPSFAGVVRHRPDASICPRRLAHDREQIETWLRQAILRGNCGRWTGEFPQVVWHREGGELFEAVLTRPENGEYHGYPLEPGEEVEGLQ